MKLQYLLKLFCIALLFASCNNENEEVIDYKSNNSGSAQNQVFAIKDGGDEPTTLAGGLSNTKWDNGYTIRIQFINGGSAYAKQKVEEYAREWLKYANLNFEFITSGTSDVRIAFNYQDSYVAWSKIGKKALSVSRTQPTMNLPYYNDIDVDSKEFRATVLREFGHVLGLVFEHQGPNASGLFDWDEGKVITYFRQQGWTQDETLDLIEDYYTPQMIKGTIFDEESIMLLYFPAFLTKNNKETKWNTELSELDKAFIRDWYPGRNASTEEVPSKMTVKHLYDNKEIEYTSVRIGEYLWLNSNLTYPQLTAHVSQHQINRSLWILGIDTLNYIVSPSDFHKYIGEYYSNGSRLYDLNSGTFREVRPTGSVEKQWGLPSKKDFRQLFAMCDDGSANAVLTNLSYKENEVPIARKVQNNHWMHNTNTNKYGFNLVYAGARQHSGTFTWTNKENGRSIVLAQSDLQQAFNMHTFPATDGLAVLEDYPSTEKFPSNFNWLPVRWCRKLTDAELGYKLYVNADQTDIKKLGLSDTAPAGYTELGNGYLRGFYVQYILDNPNPTKTISDIKNMALQLPDVTHHGTTIL